MKSQSHQVCPACTRGQLHKTEYQKQVEYRSRKREIPQIMLQCDHCKAALFDEECGRFNRRAYIRFQKEVDGVPTGPQIRDLRIKLNLTSEKAGVLLGGGPKAFSKYENEEIVPRGAMRTLLNYLIAHPERIDEVLEANGKKPTGQFARQADVELVHSTMSSSMAAGSWQLPPTGIAAEVFTDADFIAQLSPHASWIELGRWGAISSGQSPSRAAEIRELASTEFVIAQWARNAALA
jgi:HTH-type transcriptional regulator / antitoxin MqsA